jgi:NAD(P)-dependent dehydrogenase (short-subunit alcohol dehydrogenase family)
MSPESPECNDSRTLENQVALVTGSGRGIGAATARLLAARGAKVVLVSRTSSELEAVAKSIRDAGGQALAIAADVSDEASVKRLFERAASELGQVSILVNNAAIVAVRPIPEIAAQEWDRVMAVNVRGPFLCSREAFAQMRKSGHGGSIVNIASLSGIRGTEKFPGMASYVTSKFAVVGLTESFASEGRAHGIRVNCVAPGAVDTEMLRQAAPHLKTSTTPDDIARTIAFLCDRAQSGSLNGAVIEVFSNL